MRLLPLHARRVFIALLLLLLTAAPLGVSLAAQTKPAPEVSAVVEQIDAMVAAEFAKDPAGSVTIGLVVGPDLVWTKSYGYADMETRKEATRDTVYRIGSITKQFTALMLLQLAEQGKVHLTDPVEKYFPDIGRVPKLFPEQAPITLVQLATMTAGLAREPAGPPDHSVGPVARWEEKVMAAIPFVRYQHEPDTHYLYSNIGYAMLGIALGRAAGQPYADHVRQHIIAPLGLTSTDFEPGERMRAHLSRAYVQRNGKVDGEIASREHEGRGYRVPNGAIFSTVGDLARFLAFELGFGPAGVLKQETQEDNFSRLNSASGGLTSGYGVGFQVSRRGELVAHGHGGSTAGYRAQALFDRATKTGVVLLRSAEGGSLDPTDLAMTALDKIAAANRKKGTQ